MKREVIPAADRVRRSGARGQRLSSVANAIRLTLAFSDHEFELGISALAVRLGLAKSTVHRLASTLVDYGMLEQNPETGRYRPGLALFELGTLVRRKMDIWGEARSQLQALRETTGETAQLAIFDHLDVLYIHKMESRQAVRMASDVGSRGPSYCTGVGKALLAFQSPEMIRQVVEAGMKSYTPNTITSAARLETELVAIRSRGYAIDDEEMEIGLRCVAAPIRNHSGRVIAAIGVAGPVQRMTKKTIQGWLSTVLDAANAISRRLGFIHASVGMRAGMPYLRDDE